MCADLKPSARLPGLEDNELETHKVITQRGGKAIFVKTDVTSAKDWDKLIESTVKEYGRLDVYVSVAHMR